METDDLGPSGPSDDENALRSLFGDLPDKQREAMQRSGDMEALKAELLALYEATEDPDAPSLDVVIGNFSFVFTGVAKELVWAVGDLAMAMLGDAAKLKDALGSALKVLKALTGGVRRLDGGEVRVCTAIAALGGEHWRAHEDPAVTAAQMNAWWKKREEEPIRNLDDILKGLVKKGVILEEHDEKGDKGYRIAI